MAGFAEQIANFRKSTEARASKKVRRIALEIHKQIVMRSPVDTGRFRANNQVSINTLPVDAVLEVDKSGQATLLHGQEAAATYNLGDTIFIYNNVPYAFVLEFGRNDGSPGSTKAPEGVFRISFQHVISRLRSVASQGAREGL